MAKPRLYYDKKKEIWDPLVSNESEMSIFNSYKDLFLLAVCIGFANDERKPLTDSGKEGEIFWEYLSEENKMAIDAIVLSTTSDLRLLIDSDEKFLKQKIDMAQEFANGGIEIIKKEVLEQSGSPLDNLISYIHKISKKEKKKGYIENIEDEF